MLRRWFLLDTSVLAAVLLGAAPMASAQEDDLLGGFGDSAPAAEPAPAATPSGPSAEPASTIEAAPASAPAAEPAPIAPAPASMATTNAALDRVKAVPKKSVLKVNRVEVAPFFSMSLNDAYYQHLAGSAQVTFYPHDSFGVGLGGDYLYAHVRTSNVDLVRQGLTSVPAVFELPRLFVHADFTWVPVYGKASLFDSSILAFELYANAGLGVATAFNDRWLPAANVGIGQRIFVADWMAMRLEVRNHTFLDTQEANGLEQSDLQNYVMFMAGVSFFIPPSFEYTY